MEVAQLDRLSSLLVAFSEDASLAPVLRDVWQAVVGQEGLSFLCRAAAIYHLSEFRAADGLPLYRRVQLTEKPASSTWPEFCLNHLDVAPSTASNYKKLWLTYVVDYGASPAQLLAAGVGKLVAARKMFSVTQDERLVEALFGDPPATYAELLVILGEMRQDGEAEDRSTLRCDVEESETDVVVLLTMSAGDEEYYLPTLTVPFSCVPAELAEDMVGLLRRKFT